MSFQKRPTTTGESIIGTRISVVSNPLPLNFSCRIIASAKPTRACSETESRAYFPVTAKLCQTVSLASSAEKFCVPIQTGAAFPLCEYEVKLRNRL